MKIPQFLLILWLLMVHTLTHGQSTKSRLQHLTIEDGLPQNMVDCLLQDSHGFIWIGTWNGLCRYNGYDFEIFDSPVSGLDDTFIYALEEDYNGNIWVGNRVGLSIYLSDKSTFKQVQIPGFSGSIEVRDFQTFGDSTILMASDRGLTFLRANNNGDVKVRRHLSIGEELIGSIVNTVTVDSWNNIWIGTDERLYLLPEKGELKSYQPADGLGLVSGKVLSITESRNKDIWVGTEFGFYQFLKSSQTFVAYFNNPNDSKSLIHNTVMDILELENGHLLLATLGGLSDFNPAEKSFTNYTHDPNIDHSLSNDFVNCLLKDRAGNLWIGTERGGINFYNTSLNQIEHFEHLPDNENSLSVSTINSIYEDSKYLWIGTAGGGLNRYNLNTGVYKHFRYDPSSSQSLSSDFVTSIIRDRNGDLWVGTWGAGLNRLAKQQGTFQRFSLPPGLVSSYVSSVEEDKRGDLWIGTLGGISRYNQLEGRFEVIFSDQTSTKITNVGCLLFDNENSLWVGSRFGLYHLQSADGFQSDISVKHYRHNDNDPSSISGNYVISLKQTYDGSIWIGTYGQGVNRLVQKEDSVWFESYGASSGLSNTVVYGIEEDRLKNLWFSTDYGLSKFNPTNKTYRNYFQADGFLNNQYYWSASYKNMAGKLYFGGMNGLDAFFPEGIQQDVSGSETTITNLNLLNEPVKPGQLYNDVEVLSRSIYNAESIELSYKEKVVGFEFSALNYQEPGMVRYAYILENFEKEWNYVSSNRRYASYTNLKPGNYLFKVKSSGGNGEFDGPVRTIAIHINPPFWDTVWFRALSIVGLILVFFGYVRFRTYNLNRQKRLLEKQVKERTERINQQNEALSFQAVQLQRNNDDLEIKQKLIEGQNQQLENQNREIVSQRDEVIKLNDKLNLVSQLKLSFFTNISHEFRTPLTLIIGPIEKLLKDKSVVGETRNTIEIMNRNAQRLLHLINQIMDFRKIEKGRMELKVAKGDISAFCKHVFEAFEPLAQTKSIEFAYEENDVPTEVWFDSQKMENVLYNLLSNAFKYTPVHGKVKLILTGLKVNDSRLSLPSDISSSSKRVMSIQVVDTGIGISQENLPLVFKRFYRIESEEAFKISGSGIGLALTEELVKTHHGEIFVKSSLNEGSTFEVQFPCLEQEYSTSEITDSQDEGLNIHEQVALLNTEFLVTEEVKDETQDERLVKDSNKHTILVVEDNKDLRRFMAHRLREQYTVLEAEDGAVGIDLAEKHAPDLIISDVMMPNVDGLELCASLKNNLSTSHIPIILLTAKSAIENQIEGLQIGADDYLAKPFNFDLLEVKASNLIETRRKLREKFTGDYPIQAAEVTTNPKDQKFVERALDIVVANLANSDFGVKEFVEAMGISRSLLHKKLTSLTELSAAEFINHQRMHKARILLVQNELNVSEVAYSVGYNDPKYFSRLFSKTFGQSPKDYLNNHLIEG